MPVDWTCDDTRQQQYHQSLAKMDTRWEEEAGKTEGNMEADSRERAERDGDGVEGSGKKG